MASALVSLPLDDRLSDGFHRDTWPRQHRSWPPHRRRHASDAASPRRSGGSRAASADGAGPEPPSAAHVPRLAAERPATFAHLRDGVATSDLVRRGLGDRYAEDLVSRLDAGDPAACTEALALAGPVSLGG